MVPNQEHGSRQIQKKVITLKRIDYRLGKVELGKNQDQGYTGRAGKGCDAGCGYQVLEIKGMLLLYIISFCFVTPDRPGR